MRSLHGMHVHGFPNMFVLGHTQGGFTVNYPHLLEEASAHLSHILRHAIDHDLSTVEATDEGEADWLVTLAESARDIRTFQEQCTPGYYNNEGQPAAGGFLGSSYGSGPMPYFQLLADWRDAGTLHRPGAAHLEAPHPNAVVVGPYAPASSPVMALKSEVEFRCGKGSGGSVTPRAAHSGAHPSPGRHSTSRPGGASARTRALCAS